MNNLFNQSNNGYEDGFKDGFENKNIDLSGAINIKSLINESAYISYVEQYQNGWKEGKRQRKEEDRKKQSDELRKSLETKINKEPPSRPKQLVSEIPIGYNINNLSAVKNSLNQVSTKYSSIMSELEEMLFEYRSKLEFLNSNGLLDDFYDELSNDYDNTLNLVNRINDYIAHYDLAVINDILSRLDEFEKIRR